MNIAFIPIDNRPVCYTLPEQVCAINSSINLFMPERKYLGSLTKYADVDKIFEWLEKIPQVDAIVMCLDTVAYGGLISSRRCPDTFDEIKNRVENLKSILEKKNAKIYAFSSIMRISNNNVNEEEKEYWDKWGKKIFDYSYQTHKLGTESCISNIIPSEILDDYLATRKRNFEINKLYLEYQKQGLFDTLVFSKDDCAEYGFNVQEAQVLEKLGGFIKTGADEIPLTLLARAVVKFFNAKMQRCKDVKSFTEPVAQSRHCECERSNPVKLNTVITRSDERRSNPIQFNNDENACNVNSKAVGQNYYPDNKNFLKLQTIRFLDDWAYQANVRQELNSPDEKLVKEKMKPYEKMVFGLLGVAYNISYKFTWNRLFEVEICILSN